MRAGNRPAAGKRVVLQSGATNPRYGRKELTWRQPCGAVSTTIDSKSFQLSKHKLARNSTVHVPTLNVRGRTAFLVRWVSCGGLREGIIDAAKTDENTHR